MYYKKINVSSKKIDSKRFSQTKHDGKFAYCSTAKRKSANEPERKFLIIDFVIDDRRYYMEIENAEIIAEIMENCKKSIE